MKHIRFKFLDHCGDCGAVVVFFQHDARTRRNQLAIGCDCPPDCGHEHAPAVYDMAYAVPGEPVRSRASIERHGSRSKE